MGGENKKIKQSGGISTVYGVAGRRHRRCSSATRVSLVHGVCHGQNSGRANTEYIVYKNYNSLQKL